MKAIGDGDALFAPMWNALASLWLAGTAVLNGCAPSGSAFQLKCAIAAGEITVAGTRVSVAGGTLANITANAGGEARYDLAYVDAAGNIGYVAGGTACPAIPADCVPIAVLQVDPEQTALPADRIHDCRALVAHLVVQRLLVGGDLAIGGGVSVSGALWAPQAQLVAPAAPDAGLLVHEDLTSSSRSPSGYVTVKSVTVPSRYIEDGGVYVDFNVGGLGYVQVIGGNETLTNPGVMTGLAAGDVIELQLQGNNDQLSTNTMFRVYAYEKPISAGRPWA